MTCKCISYNQPRDGQTDQEVILEVPGWAYWREDERKTVCVDACIVDAVRALWDAGIWTVGSCCGHGNPDKRTILVENDDVNQALAVLSKIDPTVKVGAWALVYHSQADREASE